MSDDKWWCALIRTPGLGGPEALGLLQRFGDPRALFAARASELQGLGLRASALAWLRAPDWNAVQRDLDWLEAPGHHLVTWGSPGYPPLLAEIPDAPIALFVSGDPAVLARPAIAVVGSRNPTAAGAENAEAFAEYLAACGFVIVSGLALGVDAAAHRGALRGGTTVAVCGTGLDTVYPPRHAALAREIEGRGALVSEFPMGTPVASANFPRRNRIISGLATGTLVVEAALRSGSLITARLAGEQGREVFAIPGSIHNPLAKGCHQAIRQGAKLVDEAAHIVEELGAVLGAFEDRGASRRSDERVRPGEPLDDDYVKLLECMEETPLPIDKLVTRSGLTPDVVSSMLLIMELRGLVESAPGGGYARRPGEESI